MNPNEIAQLIITIITKAIKDKDLVNIIPDLSLTFHLLRKKNEQVTNQVIEQLRLNYKEQTASLKLINEIVGHSQKPTYTKFSDISTASPAVVERLFLIFNVCDGTFPVNNDNFLSGFVERSPNILEIGKIAQEVEKSFAPATLIFARWQRNIIPCIFQKIIDTPELLQEFTLLATSNNPIPETWQNLEPWLRNWVEKQSLSYFNIAASQSNYQPLAINPLVLRILRKSCQEQLNRQENVGKIQQFCQWLVENAFNNAPTLLKTLKLENIFAAGSFILALATQQGVVIEENGQLTIPENATIWGELSEKVLDTIVINSKNTNTIPAIWQNQQPKIRELINLCPEWHSVPLIFNLRKRSLKRLTAKLEQLKNVFQQADNTIKQKNFLPEAEYGGINQQIDTLEADIPSLQEIPPLVYQAKKEFEECLASPLAKATLPELLLSSIKPPENLNMPLASYLEEKIAYIPLDNIIIQANTELQETNSNQKTWIDAINQNFSDNATSAEILKSWATLEIWNPQRGRGGHEIEGPTYLTDNTTAASIDPNTIRPQLAEIVHLGINIDGLVDRLEALLKTELPPPVRSLLAATRLEIGITAITLHNQPNLAFKQLETINDNNFGLRQILDWVTITLTSNNAWETRAGMNVLILLARLAEVTGDLYIIAGVKQASATIPRVSQLINHSITKVLTSATPEGESGLTLALIAFDITRYTRESLLRIAPGINQSLTPPELIEALAEKLSTSGNYALEQFSCEAGEAGKILVLALFQSKLDQLKFSRQITVQPLLRKAKNLSHNKIVSQLDGLLKTLRLIFYREELLLKTLPEGEITPRWSINFSSIKVVKDVREKNLLFTLPFNEALQADLQLGIIPSTLSNQLRLSKSPIIHSEISEKRWLILEENTYLVEKQDQSAAIYQILIPLAIYNWAASYNQYNQDNLFNQAATLESAFKSIAQESLQDIDGCYVGEFPNLSWAEARTRLQNAFNELENLEEQYINRLQEQINGNRLEEMIQLLKQPLNLATVDYQEQIKLSIADVRKAEAELEVAELESVAADFEVAAHSMFYEAAKVEIEKQSAFEEISKLDQDIAKLDQEIEKLHLEQTKDEIKIRQNNLEIAKKTVEQAIIRVHQIKRAKRALLQEVELIKKVLNEALPQLSTHVQKTLITKLNTELEKARKTLEEAKEAEEEARRKRNGWGKIVNTVCGVVGAVAGAIFGGPAGAVIGAQIGDAVGNIANGIIEGKPFEEIFVGALKDGFTIAAAAGFNLELELNSLGAQGAGSINQLLGKIDTNLDAVLGTLPKVIDEQMFNTAVQIFDLKEVPVLTQVLQQSYGDFKKDVNKLDNIGTVLTQIGTSSVIRFDNPRQFLDHLTNNLFSNTTSNIKNIEAVSKALGKRFEDLLNNPDAQRKAMEEFGKIVLTKISQETLHFQRQLVSNWIALKQQAKQYWTDLGLRDEATRFVEELFPDPKVRYEVLSKIEQALGDPTIIKAKIQQLIAPWQQALDKKINEITAMDKNQQPSGNAVEAATKNVEYLEGCINKFNGNLLPWLRGENNAERTQLILKLDQIVTKDLPDTEDNLKISELEEQKANLNEDNASITLEIVQKELEKVKDLYKITEIKVSQSDLRTKAVQLAKLQSQNLASAQENSLKAAEAKLKARQADIKAAKYNLESYEARSQGALLRGAEASMIRDTLSQPVFRLPKSVTTSTNNQVRLNYLKQLENAFKAYRELLRYYYASLGASDNQEGFIPSLDTNDSWSITLKQWHDKIGQIFTARGTATQSTAEYELNLTPEQIRSLFSPEGFKICAAPHISSETILFSVPLEWQGYLDELSKLNNPDLINADKEYLKQIWQKGFEDLWLREFARNSILINDVEKITIKKKSQFWIITDSGNPDSHISFTPSNSQSLVEWSLPNPVSYFVTKSNNKLNVMLRNNRTQTERSDYSDRHFISLDNNFAKTGKIAAMFFEGKIQDSDKELTKQDYNLEITHQGDFWLKENNQLLIQLWRKRKLSNNRIFFVKSETDLRDRLADESDFFQREGDPNPYSVQGNPYSGTTAIRMIPRGSALPFESLKLTILYSYFG